MRPGQDFGAGNGRQERPFGAWSWTRDDATGRGMIVDPQAAIVASFSVIGVSAEAVKMRRWRAGHDVEEFAAPLFQVLLIWPRPVLMKLHRR